MEKELYPNTFGKGTRKLIKNEYRFTITNPN